MKLSILDRAPRKQVCVRVAACTAMFFFHFFFVWMPRQQADTQRERAHRGGAVNDLNLLYDLY